MQVYLYIDDYPKLFDENVEIVYLYKGDKGFRKSCYDTMQFIAKYSPRDLTTIYNLLSLKVLWKISLSYWKWEILKSKNKKLNRTRVLFLRFWNIIFIYQTLGIPPRSVKLFVFFLVIFTYSCLFLLLLLLTCLILIRLFLLALLWN